MPPDSSSSFAQNNLGVAHERAGRPAQAAACYTLAAELHPHWPDPRANLGNVLRKLGRMEEAESHLRAVNSTHSAHAPAHNFLGIVLFQTDRLAEAVAEFEKAVELRPDHPDAWHNLANVRFRLGHAETAVAALRRTLELRPGARAHSGFLYNLHYADGISKQQMFEEHRAWADRYEAPLQGNPPPQHTNDPDPRRRLRVGYVSPDFRRHSVATFFEPVLTHHDREAFEVICYSAVTKPDEATDRMRRLACGWRDVAQLPDDAAASLIRHDEVDILVDLTGHMGGNRLGVFARKPAPIQVSYLGYPDTTGLTSMDYRLSDAYLDPPGHSERFHTERVIRLPNAVGCYQPPPQAPDVGPLPAERSGIVTFACLNNPAKVSSASLKLWCELLRKVPDSRLVVRGDKDRLAPGDADVEYASEQRRIQWLSKLPDKLAYLNIFNEVDIALDPFPYNGHTTSCDGFWMGVPLVTLAGDRYSARMGVSLLSNLGFPELIAQSPDEFIPIAAALATDLPRLASIRSTLRQRFRSSPLCNGVTLTRNIEAAYRQMWHVWCRHRRDPAL